MQGVVHTIRLAMKLKLHVGSRGRVDLQLQPRAAVPGFSNIPITLPLTLMLTPALTLALPLIPIPTPTPTHWKVLATRKSTGTVVGVTRATIAVHYFFSEVFPLRELKTCPS